ncbi:MAG: RNase adapter RapZ [Acidobacteria bacterium]|nr:MAG: RNase adapter RapZ [Acidobacteriota bacterium]
MEPIIVVTGLSGSGKSLAARCFEDLGYFCIDNLPVTLIPVLIELLGRSRNEMRRVVLIVDVREGELLREFPRMIRDLRGRQVPLRILYFDSSNEALIRRFSETRRPHPLDEGQGLEHAIARERERLDEVRELADRIIDTSRFNAHELRAFLRTEFSPGSESFGIGISVVSFGFKYGLPADADLVFDVRFVPNPFFVDGLKSKNGLDPEVVAYLEEKDEYRGFIQKVGDLMEYLLPGFVKEGKSYLTVAVGCTGGRHRSVAAAEHLRERLRRSGFPARITHRDIDKE